MLLGELRNMDQSVDLVRQFDEGAERGDFGHLASYHIADLVELFDVFPGIVFDLLEAQRNALLFGVDVQNHGFDFIAGAQDFGRIVDLAGPRHIGNMDHAVDIVFDFDEGAVAGHVADLALDAAADGVLFEQDFPRIAFDLADAEGDFLVFLVDVEHHGFDDFTLADHFGRLGDALGPGHFGHMDQTFDAAFEFDESAVGHDVDHRALDPAADRVFDVDIVPRIAGLLLVAQRNAFLGEVDVADEHFDFLADFEQFARMREPTPGHVGDVEQSVDAAEVDEGPEVDDILDHAFAQLTDFHFLEQLAPAVAHGFFEQFAARNHDVAAIGIDLEDLDVIFLADVVVHVADLADIDLRTRQEGFHALNVDDDPAFDPVLHEALDHGAFAAFSGDPVPGHDGIGLVDAQHRHAVFIFDLFEEDLDFVAARNRFPVREFVGGDEAFGLVADIDQSAVGALFSHHAVKNRAGHEFLFGGGDSGEEFFHGGHVFEIDEIARFDVLGSQFFCHLVVVDSVFCRVD
ncbi:hypothetical protein SDC9_70229 [bioreactor metagenome]|uniref:NAD-specific glutamate dehydrogenase n=1 Tax=bioreactor metagenome TaxID=1076179 RepID=A0A644Y5D8_9ZZZZ